MRIEIRIDVDVDIEEIVELYFGYYEDTDLGVNEAIDDYITNIYDSDCLDLLIEKNEYDKIVEEVKKSIERKKQCLDKLFM